MSSSAGDDAAPRPATLNIFFENTLRDVFGAGAMKVVACWRAPPTSHLLRAWRAICVRGANTRRALRRVDARGAGAALFAWGCVARAQGRLRRVGQRVVARLLARSACLGFGRWRDAAAILVQQRYPEPCTLNAEPFALYPTPYTLYPTPYTLDLEPETP